MGVTQLHVHDVVRDNYYNDLSSPSRSHELCSAMQLHILLLTVGCVFSRNVAVV